MHGHTNVKCEAFLQCISPKWDSKCAEYKYKFIYASQYGVAFKVPVFLKLSLLLICYPLFYLKVHYMTSYLHFTVTVTCFFVIKGPTVLPWVEALR